MKTRRYSEAQVVPEGPGDVAGTVVLAEKTRCFSLAIFLYLLFLAFTINYGAFRGIRTRWWEESVGV